jgi:hypothetical protein
MIKEKEIIKSIRRDLKEGEPFSFRQIAGKLYVGVRYNYDKQFDEFTIFVTGDYSTTGGLLKK